MMKKILISVTISVSLLFLITGAVYSAENITFHVAPELIKIGIQFNGTTLHVSGTIPADCEAVV